MASLEPRPALISVAPAECPPPGLDRRVIHVWPGGGSRIQLCISPYTCKRWTDRDPIPDNWKEITPPSLARPVTECETVLVANASQAAALTVDRGEAAAASRLPRSPRQARTPRSARIARQPRRPRAARRPRRPRRSRPPRVAITPRPRRPRGTWYCYYHSNEVGAPVVGITQVGPRTPEQHAALIKRDQGRTTGFEWFEHVPCPDTNLRTACSAQAAAVVRPLQELLGWKRPEYPTPEEIKARRHIARPVVAPSRPATGPAPVVPPPSTYVAPPVGTYLCLKDTATNHVDCYANAGGLVFWSNYQHGVWQGEPAPAGAPFGAGVGA